MDWEKKSLRVGAAAVGVAILLRLVGNGALGTLTRALTSQEVASAILLMETGRVVKPGQTPTVPEQTQPSAPETQPATQATVPEETQVQTATVPETQPAAVAAFSKEDAGLVSVNSVCGYKTDVPALLKKPLSWNLTEDAPTVLIIHSHATESYTKTEKYTESSKYRTKNSDYNVVSIGTEVEKVLEKGGVGVIHDKTLHDSPSYNDAYNNARASIEKYLKKYPSIQLVLDIHRDSVEDPDGNQMKFSLTADGKSTAQLMMVVGSDAGGLTHPNWPENMSLAVKLHAQLEKNTPGICRPISFRSQRFNQDLSPGALIVEVGAAGNTRKEALAAAKLLGQAVLDIAGGTG